MTTDDAVTHSNNADISGRSIRPGRIGKAKAITATARRLAVILYRMLRDHTPYRNQPAAVYDERHKRRALHSLRKRAQSLGFDLVQADTGLILESPLFTPTTP